MRETVSMVWQGGLKGSKDILSAESGALKDNPYGFNTRFEDTPGTNPEELIDAAHASCLGMALPMMLSETGPTIERTGTRAEVTLDEQPDGFAIAAVHLVFRVRVPGTDAQTFEQIANKAKAGCPVSKVFNAKISLNANLDG